MPQFERGAVVIGNGEYNEGRLENPTADAQAIKQQLDKLQFVTMLRCNLDREGIFEALDNFQDRFTSVPVSLLFYAGHGLQYESKNYLLPIDARIRRPADIDRFGVDLEHFIELFGKVAGTSILFLDCCRTNPFVGEILRNSAAEDRDLLPIREGMADVTAAKGTFIAFATGPNKVAKDGSGKNSPFTDALLKHIGQPNQSIFQMMIKVNKEVSEATNGQQLPWNHHCLLEDFIFRPVTETRATVPVHSIEDDDAAWLAVSASNNLSVFADFIRTYPASKYRAHAEDRIEQIQTYDQAQKAKKNVTLSAQTQLDVVPIRTFDASRIVAVESPGWRSAKPPELGHPNMVGPVFLEGLVAISLYSVARVVFNDKGIGTAFIARGSELFGDHDTSLYALTAFHVVSSAGRVDSGADPACISISFEGMSQRGYSLAPIPVEKVVWESPTHIEAGCDCAILSLGDALPDFAKPIRIARDLPEFDPKTPLSPTSRPNVISVSFPYGGRGVQFGNIDNYLLDYSRPAFDTSGQPVEEVVQLHYTAASEPGSSGCPILNEYLEVVGLHVGGGDQVPRLNSLDGHYAANFGVWIQSVIRSARGE